VEFSVVQEKITVKETLSGVRARQVGSAIMNYFGHCDTLKTMLGWHDEQQLFPLGVKVCHFF
jgi:hypothetical protein